MNKWIKLKDGMFCPREDVVLVEAFTASCGAGAQAIRVTYRNGNFSVVMQPDWLPEDRNAALDEIMAQLEPAIAAKPDTVAASNSDFGMHVVQVLGVETDWSVGPFATRLEAECWRNKQRNKEHMLAQRLVAP